MSEPCRKFCSVTTIHVIFVTSAAILLILVWMPVIIALRCCLLVICRVEAIYKLFTSITCFPSFTLLPTFNVTYAKVAFIRFVIGWMCKIILSRPNLVNIMVTVTPTDPRLAVRPAERVRIRSIEKNIVGCFNLLHKTWRTTCCFGIRTILKQHNCYESATISYTDHQYSA